MALGGALTLPTLAGLMAGCKVDATQALFVPETLTAAHNDAVVALSEIIIPETDTPGAKAARVNEFIDLMLTKWYPEEYRSLFLEGLAEVEKRSKGEYGSSFDAISLDNQNDMMSELEKEAISWMESEEVSTARSPEIPFFVMIKELTVAGYYTSEIGATQELKYMPMGEYKGSVPFSEIGRAWS